MSDRKTAQQPYKSILKEGDFEVRFYEEALLATVAAPDKSFRGDANGNFRKLAGYIFGNNQQKENIGMTAPVHLSQNDTGSTMSFVMPQRYSTKNLPVPADPSIKISTMPAGHFAVLNFGGFASEDKIVGKINLLQEWLKSKNYKVIGKPTYLGYNPPYQLFGRHNEVIVEIEW